MIPVLICLLIICAIQGLIFYKLKGIESDASLNSSLLAKLHVKTDYIYEQVKPVSVEVKKDGIYFNGKKSESMMGFMENEIYRAEKRTAANNRPQSLKDRL